MNNVPGSISDTDKLRWIWTAGAIFLGGMFLYITWRWSLFIVWDDTSSAGYNKFVAVGNSSLSDLGAIFKEAFSFIRSDGYRPIHHIFRSLGNAYVLSIGVNTQLFIVLNGIMFGLAVLIYYHVSGFFIRAKAARAFTIFLFFASTPVLSGSLVLISGIQLQLFITFLTILAVYLHHDRDGRRVWLVPLGLLLIVGPWVHEMVGITGFVLIIVREVIYRRGVRLVGVIGAVGFLHALFPTFLVSLFADTLPVVMVHKIGNLGTFLAAPEGLGLLGVIRQLHWRVFLDIFSIMPPSLLVTGLGVFCWSSLAYWRTSPENFRQQLFLFIIFIATYVPFLKIFNEHVHLAYCLIPLSILLARQVEFVYKELKSPQFIQAKVAATVLLTVTSADHMVNIVAERQVTREMYKTIISLADRFKEELPLGTVIVSNAHHIEDIRFYTDGHIDPWNSNGAIPDRTHWLRNDVNALQTQLSNWRDRDVYFLDMRLPRTQGQRSPERFHMFVRDKVIDMEPLGRIASMRYSYPFFDPLRFLLPVLVSKWPGPPDLEFDYYRGPALSGTPFMSEVALDYFFYKITGDKVKIRSWTEPTLLANIHGFNLVGYGDIVYAIPQPEGAFDINRVWNNGYSRTFQGPDVETVKHAIQEAFSIREVPEKNPPRGSWTEPTLLAENFHGFNLVGYNDFVYAIPQPEGAFDIKRIQNNSYSRSFQGPDLETVKHDIESAELKTPPGKWKEPTLLAENFHGFNLVGYNDFVYAIPQSEGAFDIKRIRNNSYSRSFQGPDLETVKHDIQKTFENR